MKKIGFSFLFSLLILVFNFSRTKAEDLFIIPNCNNSECLTSAINDIVVANNKSFFLVSYNSSFIRRIDIDSNLTVENSIIPLNNFSSSLLPFNISISNDDNQALIFNKDFIYLLNLSDNSVRELNIEGEVIKNISFLDEEGNKLVATNENSSSPKLLLIDAQTLAIEKTIPLPDIGDTITVTPSRDMVLILFKNVLTQTLCIYEISSKRLYRFDLPNFFFFAVDEFLNKIGFDQNGNKAILSSLDGIHVLHLVDLKKVKFDIKVLSKKARGKTLSTLNKEGTSIISAGQNNSKNEAIIYKSIISNHKKPIIIKRVHLKGITALNDMFLSDENKTVLLFAQKETKPTVLVLNLKDLSIKCEIELNEIFLNSQFVYMPDKNLLLLLVVGGTEIGVVSAFNSCQE